MPRENRMIHVGDVAPDFCLPAIEGSEICLGDFRDRHAVLLLFFRGTW